MILKLIIDSYIIIIMCDRAYENQPCRYTNMSYHNFCSVNTNTLQSLTEMQNLMEDLIKLTE